MSDYSEFFLNSHSSVVQYELLEVTHPSFSQTIRVVRNNTQGVTVTLETAAVVTFDYFPVQISRSVRGDDLDYGLSIEIGDVGDVLPLELDLIEQADTFGQKPTFIYRTYRSDDLTVPLFGPLTLQVEEFSFSKFGAKIEARAPALSLTQTGLVYTLEQFPTLRAFL